MAPARYTVVVAMDRARRTAVVDRQDTQRHTTRRHRVGAIAHPAAVEAVAPPAAAAVIHPAVVVDITAGNNWIELEMQGGQ